MCQALEQSLLPVFASVSCTPFRGLFGGHSRNRPADAYPRSPKDELSADLAVCIGSSEGFEESNPFYRAAKYLWVISEYDDWGDAFDFAKGQLGSNENWRILLRIKDQWLGGIKGPEARPGSAGILIFFRWLLQQKIIENGLLSEYERFTVTRSDFYYRCPHPPLDLLDPMYIWIPLGEDYGGFTDRHIVANSADIIPCLALLSDIVVKPKQLYNGMLGFQEWNLERFIRYQFAQAGLEGRVRRFPYIMTAVRGDKDRTRYAVGSFDPTVGMIVKYPSEMKSASQYRGRINSARDWAGLYNANGFHELISPAADFKRQLERSWAEIYARALYRNVRARLGKLYRKIMSWLGKLKLRSIHKFHE